MKKLNLRTIAIIIVPAFFLAGCATPENPGGISNTAAGAGLGAAGGGIFGAVAGNNIPGISKTEGAVAGAIVGGLLGGAMGNQRDAMNKQTRNTNAQIASVSQQANSTVINVTNSNGSTTPVVMTRNGTQWVGPRGEYYSNLPTESQLKSVYGL